MQAGGPALGIDCPVAEGAAVVGAAVEPAVVEHEALDAEVGGRVDERQQPRELVIEVDGLPGVEHDRPMRRRAQCAHEGVEPRAQAVEAAV